MGWGRKNVNVQGFGEAPSAKAQIFNLIHSIRTVAKCKKNSLKKFVHLSIKTFFTVPLLFVNILTIIFKLLLG